MKKFSLMFALFMACGSAHAKCAMNDIAFTGKVIDAKGKPVAHAAVGLAWQDYEGIAGPATTTTNARGEYSLTVPFNTYSGEGNVVEDECKLHLRVVAVSASKDTLESPHYRFKIGRLTVVRLPVLRLYVRSANFVRMVRPAGG